MMMRDDEHSTKNTLLTEEGTLEKKNATYRLVLMTGHLPHRASIRFHAC